MCGKTLATLPLMQTRVHAGVECNDQSPLREKCKGWPARAQGAALLAGAACEALAGGVPPGPPPGSAREAVLAALERACDARTAAGGLGRVAAVALLCDARALLAAGRPAVVCALADLRRVFLAALSEVSQRPGAAGGAGGASHAAGRRARSGDRWTSGAQGAQGSGGGNARSADADGHASGNGTTSEGAQNGGGQKQERVNAGMGSGSLRRRLVAGERKLAYFLSWANEQPLEAYQAMLGALSEEAAQHAETLPGQGASSGMSVSTAAHESRPAVREPAGGRKLLVEEVGSLDLSGEGSVEGRVLGVGHVSRVKELSEID